MVWCMGGCQNYGPFLGVLIEEDIDIDVDISIKIHNMGGCQNYGPSLGP